MAAPNTIRGPPAAFISDAPFADTLPADSAFGDALLVHNQCRNPEGAIGTYRDLIRRGRKGDGITPHHIPSALHMSLHGVTKADALAFNMIASRHKLTFTFGTRADVGLASRVALARGIRDARRIYQREGAYNSYIRQQLQRFIELSTTGTCQRL